MQQRQRHQQLAVAMDRDVRRSTGLFTPAQYQQLLVHIRALSYAVNDVGIPENVEQAVKGFSYDKEKGQQASAWTTNHKQRDLVREITARMPDPCTALVEALAQKYKFASLPPAWLAEERHKLVTQQMALRAQQLNEQLERKDLSAAAVSQSARKRELRVQLLLEKRQLELVELQRKVRLSVLASMPADKVASGWRSKKDIDVEHKKRDRARKILRTREEKESRKSRKVYLTAVLNHGRDFTSWHREKRRAAKRNGDSVLKELEEMERKRQAESKVAEKERLAALKENNEEEYIRLLKKAKNERLLTLIRQTDQYMHTIGAHIKSEQQKRLDDNSIAHHPQSTELLESRGASGGDEKKDELDDMLVTRQRYYHMAHAIQEEVQQPASMVAGQLRSYQLHGLQWLVSLYNNQLNGILADEMGLGKTVQTCSLIAYLMEVKKNYGPFLIIVPMSTLHNNWEYEFERWFPTCAKVIYDGNREQRRAIREKYIATQNFNVLMTTFEFAMRDKAVLRTVPWEYIIIDEAHRLKNPKCKLALELATYPTRSRRVALTGTPLQNELHELWSLLNFLHPNIFNSCDNFEKWFATPFASMTVGAREEREKAVSMSEEEKLLVINRLHAILRPFMLRREKREVEKDLADKVEKVLRCELTPVQRLLYASIMEGKVAVHNRMIQLRKVCNHPLLFHPYVRHMPGAAQYECDDATIVEQCGKFALLDNILPKLKRTGHRVLIFNQMTKTMNVLEDYFRLRDYKFLRLDGTTATEDRSSALKEYNAVDSAYFIFILSTKAGGLGLNLQSADTVILFDSDWNPQNDLQAQARAHRIGQKQQVVVLRLITSSTVEEKVLATAHQKLSHEAMVIQAGMFHDHYSHTQSRTMVERAMREVLEGDEDANDDDEVCKALARSEDEYRLFQQMDAEKRQTKLDKAASEAKRAGQPPVPESDLVSTAVTRTVPSWVYSWCLHGNRSDDTSEALVEFSARRILQDKMARVDPTSEEAAKLRQDMVELEEQERRAEEDKRRAEEDRRNGKVPAAQNGNGGGGGLADMEAIDELIEEEAGMAQERIEEAAQVIANGTDFLADVTESDVDEDEFEEEERRAMEERIREAERASAHAVGGKRKRVGVAAAGASGRGKKRRVSRGPTGRKRKRPVGKKATPTPLANGHTSPAIDSSASPALPSAIGASPLLPSSRSSSPLSVSQRSSSPVLSISRKQRTLVIKLKRDDGQTEESKYTHDEVLAGGGDEEAAEDEDGHAQWEEDEEEAAADEEVDIMS